MDVIILQTVLDRLTPVKKNHLMQIVREAGEGQEVMIWDRMKYIKTNPYFAGLPSILQYRLAVRMDVIELEAENGIMISGIPGETGLVMIKKGNLSMTMNEQEIGELSENDMTGILPFMATEKDSFYLRAKGSSILYTIKQELLDELIFDYEEMALALYRWAKDQQNQEGKLTRGMVS